MTAQTRERILPRIIEDELRESFLDYSMSVIVQRALPDVRDGLKPVHRRILFAMHELGLRPDRPYKKSATVVGDVLGKYHPHGDSAVYDTLVRMVQDFSLRYPLIDGQGNFGSIDGDSAAAYRYTEARLSPVAGELLADIELETVDFVPNFDARLQEPTVLPSRIPNLLVNGTSGIAVGMSTNIPPHNLREVAAAIHYLVESDAPTVDELLKLMPGPDLPTGGFIVGTDGIRSMYETGRGKMLVRGRVVAEALRGGKQQLVVTEMPYTVSKTRLIRQIADLVRKGSITDISDIRDESDRDGIRLVIELKRGAKAGAVTQVLYKKTSLQTTFGAIMLALDGGEPKEFDLITLLTRFVEHRRDVIQRRSRHEMERAEVETHILQGLSVALDDIDAVIAIIRGSKDRPEASEKLQDRFGLSSVQADAILNMRLGKLTSLEQIELKVRLKELKVIIKELKAILKSEVRQLKVMLSELDEAVEKFGDERRTVILDENEKEIAVVEDTIADEDVVVTLSHQGFVTRVPMHLYRRRVSSGKVLAGMEKYEDDYLEQVLVARTSGYILAFTEGGHVHFLPVLDVPETGRASRGRSVYGLTQGDRDDRVVAMLPVDDPQKDDRFVVFLSERGLVKRTKLSEFGNPRAGGVIASGLRKGDRIIDVVLSDGSAEVMLVSAGGRAIRFPETDVSVVGRTAQGVKGMGLKGDDSVVGMLLLRRDAWVLTVSQSGMGKRTDVNEFPLQKRGGMGNLATPASGEEGCLVAAMEVVDGDEVMLISAEGRAIRVSVVDVPEQGRRAQGGQLVKVDGGDRIVEVTRVHGLGAAGATGTPGVAVEDPSGEAEDQLDLL